MHQKQPPPNVADSVLFVFMALVDCASADKFSAAKTAKMPSMGFIFKLATSNLEHPTPNIQ
jgi:uncharacterized PurR-regulated membrane protein YhhQ (DUF165 family)